MNPSEALRTQLANAALLLEAWKAVAMSAGMTAEEIRECYSEATEFKQGGFLAPSGEATAENTSPHPEPTE